MPHKDPVKRKEYFDEYYKNNRLTKIASAKAIYKLRPKTEEQRRRSSLKRYGLTIEQYDAVLKKQNNLCAICDLPCATGQRLSVDHCHETSEVRGLLCRKCNLMLGHADDSKKTLQKGIDYLEAYELQRMVE